jgi:hypothetical protein
MYIEIHKPMPTYCTHCGTHLRKYTVANDWNTRQLHKKCWIEIQKTNCFNTLFEQAINDASIYWAQNPDLRKVMVSAQHFYRDPPNELIG